MKKRSFPGMYALRYPLWSPEESGGEAVVADDPFAEQPGDREEAPGDGAKVDETPEPEPAAEEAPEVEEEAPAADGEIEEPAAEGEEEPAPKKDWRDKQIIKARKAEKEAREQAAADRAEVARLKALHGDDGGEGPAQTPDQIRAEALATVREEQRIQNLNKSLEDLFEEGKRAYPKGWEERVKQASEAVGQEMGQRVDFLEALADLPNRHAVYFDLAGDPDKIESLLALPPHKMGLELGKLSEKLAATKPKAVSKTPAPIKPLDKPTKEEKRLDDPNISQDEFFRLMDLEDEKRWKAKQARGY